MRQQGETIALLHHSTGLGKTWTAVSDARKLGKRTLMLAHTRELVTQARKTFKELWPEVDVGLYLGPAKQQHAHVICGSIQSVSQNLEAFDPEEFG